MSATKIIYITDHKLHHDVTFVKANVLAALHAIAESRHMWQRLI